MRYLIVNGDDLGMSRGVNRGIFEAHERGVLTSASLFVDRPWSDEAAEAARAVPGLSVGLHADLDAVEPSAVQDELRRQLARFDELMGAPPTHLDSHHNVHQRPELLAEVLAVSQESGLLVRACSAVRYLADFYGQRSGRTDVCRIDVAALVQLLKTRLDDGVTELGCHPGYVDADLASRYTAEREVELRTLCDGAVRAVLSEEQIVLVGFRDVPRLLRETSAQG